jgi:hypothetical protein
MLMSNMVFMCSCQTWCCALGHVAHAGAQVVLYGFAAAVEHEGLLSPVQPLAIHGRVGAILSQPALHTHTRPCNAHVNRWLWPVLEVAPPSPMAILPAPPHYNP